MITSLNIWFLSCYHVAQGVKNSRTPTDFPQFSATSWELLHKMAATNLARTVEAFYLITDKDIFLVPWGGVLGTFVKVKSVQVPDNMFVAQLELTPPVTKNPSGLDLLKIEHFKDNVDDVKTSFYENLRLELRYLRSAVPGVTHV
jgi:hypothetical protein